MKIILNKFYYISKVQRRFHGYQNSPYRFNELGIQMLSKSLHKQLFGSELPLNSKEKLKNTIKSLLIHGVLKDMSNNDGPNYEFILPKLRGRSLEEHFYNIGTEFSQTYKKLADNLITKSAQVYPKIFEMKSGWTKYTYKDNKFEVSSVKYPQDDILVFDVETSVTSKNIPVMATAFSGDCWYTWCSEYLLLEKLPSDNNCSLPCEFSIDTLIPLGKRLKRPQLIIGHNVSFDRSYISEEYEPAPGQRYFLDTLSLHQCVGGFANNQRKKAKTSNLRFKDMEKIYLEQMNLIKIGEKKYESNVNWMESGTFNDLNSLALFYLNQPTEKSTRDVFVTGSLAMIKDNFHKMLSYCAHDVLVTFAIFKQLWPLFLEHSPNPVSLSGILMLSKCYLPINKNWKAYIHSSDNVFDNYNKELKSILTNRVLSTLKEGLMTLE